MDKITQPRSVGTRLAISGLQIGDPRPSAGALRLQNRRHNFAKALEMTLVFRVYPLTLIGLAVDAPTP